MIFRREQLGQHPSAFRSMTGLTVAAFDLMLPELLAAFAADRRRRLDRPGRQRAVGGGDDFDLTVADQFLLTVVWLRHYPTPECLGYLFGVSDSTALRAVRRCVSRGGGAGPRRTGGTTERSRGGGSRWGTPSGGCASTSR